MTQSMIGENMSSGGDEPKIGIFGIGAALLRFRRVVFWCFAVCVASALIIALTRRPAYSSHFAFLPTAPESSGRNGLASLAGQFGIALGGGGLSESPELYADLLKTRDLLSQIATSSVPASSDSDTISIATLLGTDAETEAETLENTIVALRENAISASVATATTGVVSVAVTTPSRYASEEIANRLIEELTEFNLSTRQSQAKSERVFTEERLSEAAALLRSAENELQQFLMKNRQFESSPDLRFEHDRLQRALTLRQQVATTLAQQVEEARIREVRNTPVLTLIQEPTLAVKPDPRGRVLILIGGALFGTFVGLFAALLLESLDRSSRGSSEERMQFNGEWNEFRSKIRAKRGQ